VIALGACEWCGEPLDGREAAICDRCAARFRAELLYAAAGDPAGDDAAAAILVALGRSPELDRERT
jgi:hypothetical protein